MKKKYYNIIINFTYLNIHSEEVKNVKDFEIDEIIQKLDLYVTRLIKSFKIGLVCRPTCSC